ncbi:hypothetical protein GQR58_016642 [Nymphon striatum]|nr:hypothetical protein GQR58_016642 [Nymphon striatum]
MNTAEPVEAFRKWCQEVVGKCYPKFAKSNRELLMRDRFVHGLSCDLQRVVLNQKCEKFDEAVQTAMLAHTVKSTLEQDVSKKSLPTQNSMSDMRCFHCNQKGHIARNCFRRFSSAHSSSSSSSSLGQRIRRDISCVQNCTTRPMVNAVLLESEASLAGDTKVQKRNRNALLNALLELAPRPNKRVTLTPITVMRSIMRRLAADIIWQFWSCQGKSGTGKPGFVLEMTRLYRIVVLVYRKVMDTDVQATDTILTDYLKQCPYRSESAKYNAGYNGSMMMDDEEKCVICFNEFTTGNPKVQAKEKVNWKSQCFLTLDTKNPKRRPCHEVTFVEFHKTVLEQCRRRNDTWGNEVYTRLNCSNDLVADEGRYHRMCLQRFVINKRSPDAEVGEKGRPVDEGMQQWFQMLCIWLEVEADAELYTLQELHKKMAEIAGDEDIYGYFLHDLWDKERTRDEDREAEIVVLTAAKLIMSEIREKEYDPSVYPKSDDITAPTDRWVPNLLKRSSVLPIPFGLAVELDHVFGSKWLIDELSHLGFCSSYREVSRFKQSSMATEDASEVAVTLPPGSFAQYVADNVDHNLCTLDGKKTFHGMGIIQVSTNSSGTHNREKAIKRQKLELVNLVTKNRGIPIKQYIETNLSVMSTKIFKSMRDLQFEKNVSLEMNINLLWETSILVHKSARPSWSGFMQTYREGEYPGKSEVTVLPIIDLNPTDSSCIYSTLLFVIEQAQKANIGTATITFDQPLWLKAVKISSEKSLNILCRLGGFHTLMSFLGSVGTSMEGSGISECLQMVYGENAVVHILSGKAVSRALRAHFLLQSSLMLKIIASIIQEQHVSEEDLAGINTLYDSFVNGKSSDEELTKSKVLEKVHGAIGNKMNHLSTTSRTAKLWIQYISYIDVIKQFICGDCHGVDCENGTREIDEESNDEDGNIFDIFENNSF